MPSKYFAPKKPRFSLMDRPSAMVCSLLNTGLNEGLGAVGIHASKRGLRITLNGHTVATGKTPDELEAAFEAARRKAKASSETINPA